MDRKKKSVRKLTTKELKKNRGGAVGTVKWFAAALKK